jgi:choline dehydrogenase-like flavoprotein
LLVGWRVNEVLFDENKHATSIAMQERGTPDGAKTTIIKARKEIIMTAGTLHDPQILQRSGVGPAALLKQANISMVVDLPGVGGNLQDHPVTRVSFNCRISLARTTHS